MADVNGDGVLDEIVLARYADSDDDGDGVADREDTGAAYLWIGGRAVAEPSVVLRVPGAFADHRLGEGAGAGLQVADVDGDGVLDVVIASSAADHDQDGDGAADAQLAGAVHVWSGAGLLSASSAPLAPSVTLRVPRAKDGDMLGECRGLGIQFGDVTGDGTLDVLVASCNADQDVDGDGVVDAEDAGAIHMWAGGKGLLTGAAIKGPTATLYVPGAFAGDGLGAAAPQGFRLAEVTGDGTLDVVGLAPDADLDVDQDGVADREDVGAVYVWRGGVALVGSATPTATLRAVDPVAGDRLGSAGGRRGLLFRDLDGDGTRDLLVVASSADLNGSQDAGAIYVWRGGSALSGAPRPLATLTQPQPEANARFGWDAEGRMVHVCDLDGDGQRDVIVGAPSATVQGVAEAGAVYVWLSSALSGTASPSCVLSGKSASSKRRLAGGRAGLLCADVTGDGRSDLIVAEAGGDVIRLWSWDQGLKSAAPRATLRAEGLSTTTSGRRLRLADFNGDGTLDLLAVCARAAVLPATSPTPVAGGALRFWFGGPTLLGERNFADASLSASQPAATDRLGEAGSVLLGDVTGDGALDLVARAGDRIEVWSSGVRAGEQRSNYSLSAPGLDSTNGAALRLSDLDGDGSPEVLAVSALDGQLLVWTGGREFLDSSKPPWGRPPDLVSKLEGIGQAPGEPIVLAATGQGALELFLPAPSRRGGRGELAVLRIKGAGVAYQAWHGLRTGMPGDGLGQ
ncbi:MAG: FG-GAP-like repeat-containing protein [Planctomycetota bacterium]